MKKIYITLLLGIFLLSFTSAISELDPVRQGDCVELFQYCNDCTFVNWTGIEYPNGTIDETINIGMNKTNSNYKYKYCGVNEIGDYKYFVTGDKNDKLQQEEINFKVNLSGNNIEIKDILSRFSLVILFGVLIFFIYSSIKNVNFEKWYKKIKNKYENRNYVKMGLSAIAYQLIKNAWIIYYMIGFVIVVLLMDITYLFSIKSVFSVMKIFTFIYSWSFILVGLVFLSYLQEFFKMMLEQLEDSNWGVGNEK